MMSLAILLTAGAVNAQWTTTGNTVHPVDLTKFVGIGTATATSRLTIAGGENFQFAPNASARLLDLDMNHYVGATQSRNGAAMRIDLRWDLGVPAFTWFARNTNEPLPNATETMKMYLDNNSVLAIGFNSLTGDTTNKLQVNGGTRIVGNLHATGAITGGTVQATYQDLAEWVPATEKIPAATVVVLDPNRNNTVMPSSSAYDSAVAGVISVQPGIALGIASDDKVQVATTGRVKVKVDATKSPIKIGDLLVTGSKPGTAMRSEPIDLNGIKLHRPGTVIGKALEPLEKGEGEILVLLSLQ